MIGRICWPGAVLAILAAACTRGVTDSPEPSEPAPETCEVEFTPPPEFELRDTIHRRAPDHVGVRATFVDDAGRILNLFSGIAGEFGEGLPGIGSYRVAGGEEAALLGAGSDWVLVWDADGRCRTRAVIGNGFGREEFLALMRGMEVLAMG